MNLRNRNQFPNWSLALEFLQRSPVNILVSDALPPEPLEACLRSRVLLIGCDGEGRYFSFPADASHECIQRVASALLDESVPNDLDFSKLRSTNFITFLDSFTQLLAGKFKLREVAQAITDKASTLFEADGTSILMANKDGSFRFAVVTAESEEIRKRLDQLVIPGDSGITGWVAKHRRSLLVNDSNRQEILNPQVDARTHFRTREVLAGPIMVGTEVIGVLQVVSRRDGAFKKSDLQILELIAAIIASFIERARLYDEELELATVHKEMEIARELQLAVMPALPSRIGPFLLLGESRQTSRVGGDFWDVLELSANESLLILGDVCGHGLSAALVMSSVRTASRALMPQVGTVKALIDPLNALIHSEFGHKGHYATMLFIHLDLNLRTISYLRAGHEYPVLRTPADLSRQVQIGSWPLGMFPFRADDTWYDCPLGSEDALYLYTDGVLDGFDNEERRMDELLRQHRFLEDALDQGHFFDTLRERLGWRIIDDATMLKLVLQP